MTLTDSPLYQSVAQKIKSLIDTGALSPGDRLPSVRKFARQQNVSISTILQAYQLLETRGQIEPRPQSGFYVKSKLTRTIPEPEISRPQARPTRVSLGDVAERIISIIADPTMVALGAAVIATDHLPLKKLSSIAARLARRSPALVTAYQDPVGHLLLRRIIARRAVDTGCTLSPDDLVCTSGSQEALTLALLAVAKPGDTIAIESPTYYGILQCIEALGMRALEIPTHPRHGVSLDALQMALDSRTIAACLFVTNISNPLGSVIPDERKKKLVAMLASKNVPLIEDDIYGDLAFHTRPNVCKAYDKTGNILLCSSVSKTLAPGYRVGWIAPGKFRDKVVRLKTFLSLASATLPQLTVAEFLESGGYDRHLRHLRKILHQQMDRTSDLVCRHFPAGTKLTRPTGGCVLWVEMPKKVDAIDLYDRAAQKKIAIAPGPVFSAKGEYRNCIRLNFGLNWNEKTDQALITLGQLAHR